MRKWLNRKKETHILLDGNETYQVRVNVDEDREGGVNVGIREKGGKWMGIWDPRQKLVLRGW